ncbi:MAG: hypothetical protein Q9186_003121 [Xanthomendoza sp. 1 TL-2023]
MVVSGIAPAILGDIADVTGRRIVYLLTFAIYLAANVGLAVQNSWTAFPNVATAVGPVLGGALTQHLGWRWIFWILAIASGVCLFLISVFLPKPSRSIVGNGYQEVSGLHRTLISYVGLSTPSRLPESAVGANESSSNRQDKKLQRKFHIPNPLASLKMSWAKDTALITTIYGIYYMDLSCLQASLSPLFIDIYRLSEFNAGLIYLPFGVGSVAGAYCSGKIMNRDYRLTARSHNIVINTASGDDLMKFPIEKARLRNIWYSIGISGACTIAYGWVIHSHAFCGTLLTDLHPKAPASAQAANNIMRCTWAGAGLALLQIILDAIGTGCGMVGV